MMDVMIDIIIIIIIIIIINSRILVDVNTDDRLKYRVVA